MATIVQISEDKYSCVKRYAERALDHVRMAEHILTEILEKMSDGENK